MPREVEQQLREKGLTQIDQWSVFDSAIEWYIGNEEWYESFLEDDKTEDEAEVETEMLCEKRRVFDRLIREIFSNGCIYIYANKRDASDELTEIFGTNDFWDALSKLEKWVDTLKVEHLQFGNDDLNGWSLTHCCIFKDRENFKRIKELVKEAKDVGEI